MPQLPSGTVTFVFSDIEGSTALLKKLGDEPYTELLGRHRRLLRETFAARGTRAGRDRAKRQGALGG
jgi:class 3 adenylate cyclase